MGSREWNGNGGNGVTPTLLTSPMQLDSLLDIANQLPQFPIRRKRSGKSIACPRQAAYRHGETFRQFAQARLEWGTVTYIWARNG